ncbi:MAG: ornithine cyclodeaminase [Legionellales bacterium RIFCSPHIGHO2_12_FULL_35_11]|nr:MAG: ornithine cyclodeaminase [Legionellales bacterium RIFCSPHIGHO2_12_FULL_35_11]
MILLEAKDINLIIKKLGLEKFYLQLVDRLTKDFQNWKDFQKCSRNAMYVNNGVIELMPTCDKQYYSFKYVNGHPQNPKYGKLNIIGVGMLANVETGYPLMLASMNILTAVRTAAISALSSKYLAKTSSKTVAIIGCGAQSEFQILAHTALFDIKEVRCFDLSKSAMERFARNLANEHFKITFADDCLDAIAGADIIITLTSVKDKQKILEIKNIMPGVHICAVGGDSPGKTELDVEILKQSKVVIEYFPQTVVEGEIQNLGDEAHKTVYAELWEIISGLKQGRVDDNEVTVFDAVGFAIEDFSALRLCYDLAKELGVGKDIDFVPYSIEDCKDLYGLFLRE